MVRGKQIENINFNVLDGLRGIAALYVVINHARGNMLIGGAELSQSTSIENWTLLTKLYYGFLQLTSLGSEFVILFFVLSGFSIAHSLSGKKELSKFYARRFVRLYWPYILALFWAYGIYTLIQSCPIFQLEESVFSTKGAILKNSIYIPAGDLIPQFWSLTYEVLFYILAPLILLNQKSIRFSAIIFISLFILRFFLPESAVIETYILPKFIFNYGFYFIIGILVYRHYNSSRIFNVFRSKKKLIFGTIILFPLMVVIKFKLGDYNPVTPILSCILSIFLLLNFLEYNIQKSWLTALGRMSYTLYITHFASIFLTLFFLYSLDIISVQQTDLWYVWPIGVITSILFAIPLYLIGEKPTKVLLKKMRSRAKNKQTANKS